VNWKGVASESYLKQAMTYDVLKNSLHDNCSFSSTTMSHICNFFLKGEV